MKKVIESGDLENIKRRHNMILASCEGTKGKPLGFKNSALSFLIFGVGLVVSFIFLFVECFASLMEKRNGKQAWPAELRYNCTMKQQH